MPQSWRQRRQHLPRGLPEAPALEKVGHEKRDGEQIIIRGLDPGGSDSSGPSERVPVSLDGSGIDWGQDRLHAA